MSNTAAPPIIEAFTAEAFSAPEKFTQFCSNGGKPLGGLVGGKEVPGSMNAVFDVINPGTHEVLAQVSEMGYDEVNDAVQAGYRAFNSGWKDTPVEERIELMMKLVELFERDQEVLMACEILNGGKVSELAQGDRTHFRACAEYFADVARSMQFGDGKLWSWKVA